MKPILLSKVRKGEFFTLTDKVKFNEDGDVLSKYVYVKDDYERTTRAYWAYKFDDVNYCKLMKGTRIVFVDFCF